MSLQRRIARRILHDLSCAQFRRACQSVITLHLVAASMRLGSLLPGAQRLLSVNPRAVERSAILNARPHAKLAFSDPRPAQQELLRIAHLIFTLAELLGFDLLDALQTAEEEQAWISSHITLDR